MKTLILLIFQTLFILSFSTLLSGQDICQNLETIKSESSNHKIAISLIESLLEKHPYDSLSVPEWDLLYYNQTKFYFDAQQYNDSKRLAKKYLNWAKQNHFYESIADYYNILGGSYYYQNQTDSAAYYYVLAAEKLKLDGKDFYYAAVMNNIGVIYLNEKDYQKAIKYYKKTKTTFVALKDSTYLSDVLGNIAYSYFMVQKMDSSILYSNSAIKVGLAKKAYGGYFNGMMTLADIDKIKGDTLESIKKNEKVYREAIEQGNDNYKYRAAQALANLLTDKKKALVYAKEAYQYSERRNDILEESFLLTLVHLLRHNDEGEEAYDLLIPRFYQKDSLLLKKYENQKMDLLAKYETAEKEKVILAQQNEITNRDLNINRLLFGLSVLILLGLLLFSYIIIQKNKIQRKQDEYEKRFAQLETMVLKSQMNPHFIFNSLNSIRYLFMKDEKDKGILYITKFAKLLRNTLHHGDEALVSLADEIELAELFIDLEQLRFNDQFILETHYDNSDWKSIKIPPFVVQPLVENAFWHGLSPSKTPDKRLKLIILKNEDEYLIKIIDNGVGINHKKNNTDLAVDKKKSYGLNILKERFKLINKTQQLDYSIQVLQTTEFDSGTCVQISIKPKMT